MTKKRKTPEQIIKILREVEKAKAQGATTLEAIVEHGISEQTYYRWRAKYAEMDSPKVRRLRQLESENARLKKLVAELSLDKDILQEALGKKS